jgi:hypothetical protein
MQSSDTHRDNALYLHIVTPLRNICFYTLNNDRVLCEASTAAAASVVVVSLVHVI